MNVARRASADACTNAASSGCTPAGSANGPRAGNATPTQTPAGSSRSNRSANDTPLPARAAARSISTSPRTKSRRGALPTVRGISAGSRRTSQTMRQASDAPGAISW